MCLATTVDLLPNSSTLRTVQSVFMDSGGRQSPIPDMPSGLPSVTEYYTLVSYWYSTTGRDAVYVGNNTRKSWVSERDVVDSSAVL